MKKVVLALYILLFSSLVLAQSTSADSIIYSNDFEAGQGLWLVTNGLWSVGEDATLPSYVARAGKMAGGVLGGSVPGNAFNTYLISSPIILPSINTNEELRIGFLHWHNFNGYVSSSVSVRIDSGGGHYGNWEKVSVDYGSNLNLNYWKTASLIISKYAGKRINVGFNLYGYTNTWGGPSGLGWRLDDVRIIKSSFRMNTLPIAWDFDQDWNTETSADSWWEPYGLFCVGRDTLVTTPSKPNLAGTNLNISNIPNSSYTVYLATPGIQIPVTTDDIFLRFRYYLNVNGYAKGQTVIAVDSGNGNWGNWSLLAEYTTSTQWTRVPIILPVSYQGKRVRIGYALNGYTNTWGGPGGKGFYIDDVDLFTTSTIVTAPQLVFPVDESGSIGIRPTFRWRLVASAFNYRIQISRDPLFATTLFDASNIDPTSYTPATDLPDTVSTYFWRVCATNGLGTSSWSDVWHFNSGIIPVELISFTGELLENKIRLNWATATEINNKGFEIERSSNNKTFTTIGIVVGNGTTTEKHEYSFIDKPTQTGKYYYRLKQIDYNGTFEYSKVIEIEYGIPTEYSLEQNYPNPFNPTTTIKYSLSEENIVTLKVYNTVGEEVATLVNEKKEAGSYSLQFNSSNLSSGVYFYKLQAGDFVQTKKMVLIK